MVVNSDVCLAVNAVGKHTEEARRFVDFLTRKDNIERFSQQRCSLSPLKNKKASGKKQLTAVVSCTKAGRIVVAPDNRLKLPLNDYTEKICRNILEGMSALEALDQVLTNGPSISGRHIVNRGNYVVRQNNKKKVPPYGICCACGFSHCRDWIFISEVY